MSKRKAKKTRYKVQNWPTYPVQPGLGNRALAQRGSLTIWFSADLSDTWFNTDATKGRGRRRVYSDAIIESMLTLQAVFNLPLRQTTGLMESLLALLQVDLPVPDYTTLCRRRKSLQVRLPRKRKITPVHLVVDSTGLKVFGHGEWFGRKYFPRKGQKPRRKPRLHSHVQTAS